MENRYLLSEKQIVWVQDIYEKIKEKIDIECERMGEKIPYVPVNGRYPDMGETSLSWWTNGFWGGIMWQMYCATGEEKYKEKALMIEDKINPVLKGFVGVDHDAGFMWLPTAVANYRLTNSKKAKERGLHAANLLSGRYNPVGKFIRAWNQEGQEGVFIIDCLMNTPLLYWASKETKDPRFAQIAKNHTDTALSYIVREDGSCNHIVQLNPTTGEFVDSPAGQGYEKGSSWSRGQAWAIYGFSLNYRYTNDNTYLDVAKKIAHYFIANVAIHNYLPLLDFRAPKEPVYYDSTAGACAACGLLELSKHVGKYEKQLYIQSAISILQSMEKSFCNWNIEEDGILGYGSARYNRADDREVPIIYGDYFFIEAILELLGKGFLIW